MSADDTFLSEGGREDASSERPSGLLSQISNEMVRAQKEFFGRGPTKVKSYLLDDFLLIVMRDGFLPVEKTMLEAGKDDVVRQYRQDFENAMTARLIGKMQELTGRTIVTYQSQALFEPNIVIEIFFFEESAPPEDLKATMEGQLGDESHGEASEELTEPTGD